MISLTMGPESEKVVLVSSVETRDAGEWTIGTVTPSSGGMVKLRADIIPVIRAGGVPEEKVSRARGHSSANHIRSIASSDVIGR